MSLSDNVDLVAALAFARREHGVLIGGEWQSPASRTTIESITQIAFAWGFNNAAHFSRLFRRRYGISASQFRVRAGIGGTADPAEPVAHRRRQGRTLDTEAPAPMMTQSSLC